jgi:hypothetical protein
MTRALLEHWDLHVRAVRAGAVIGRTSALIFHDEGALPISKLAARRFRYGKTLGLYTRKHPTLAGDCYGSFARRFSVIGDDWQETLWRPVK